VINLLAPRASDRYNPLSYVRSPLDAQRLATNLTQNTEGGRPPGGDPFWPKAEGALITALVLYATMKLPPAERHLASVLELGTDLARDQQTMDAVFDSLPKGHPTLRPYNIFRLAADKTRAGILIGFAVRLQLWAGNEVAMLTAASDFDLAEPGRERTVLYLIIPDSESTFVPLTALFWTQAFQRLYAEADRSGGVLPVPVRLIMDEFANIGQITDYRKLISTCRGRGISPEMVLQDVSQLRSLYGEDDARTILASCDSLLYLGTNELETAAYVSRRLGQTTIQLTTTSTPSNPQAGASETRTFHGRPLLTPDEVLMLDSNDSLLQQRGRYPARLRKPDFTELSIPIRELAHQDYKAPLRLPLSLVDCSRLTGAPPARPTLAPPLQGKEPPPGHTGRMRLVRPILTALATEEED
jgi:type IV secretion system protein VirD4